MTDEKLLEFYGWEVECGTPLEIRHKDGSFASQQAADYVIHCLKQEYVIEQYDELMLRIQKIKAYDEILFDIKNLIKI